MNIDFVTQVALVATIDECGKHSIVAGGRYVLVQPGVAEVAFVVVDEYRGEGWCQTNATSNTGIAREAGLRELAAEVLSDNYPMLNVFQKVRIEGHDAARPWCGSRHNATELIAPIGAASARTGPKTANEESVPR